MTNHPASLINAAFMHCQNLAHADHGMLVAEEKTLADGVNPGVLVILEPLDEIGGYYR